MTKRLLLLIAGATMASLLLFLVLDLSSGPTADLSQDQLANIKGTTAEETEVLRDRERKDHRFRVADDSPLPDSLRKDFEGLSYYPYSAGFRVKGVILLASGIEATMDTSLKAKGGVDLLPAGTVVFRLNGQEQHLKAWWEEGSNRKTLFVAFRDSTSGAETYGGGRYLSIPVTPDSLTLDFNRAYHPYCVYNPAYICPIPPKENTLPLAVKAGEKLGRQYY